MPTIVSTPRQGVSFRHPLGCTYPPLQALEDFRNPCPNTKIPNQRQHDDPRHDTLGVTNGKTPTISEDPLGIY